MRTVMPLPLRQVEVVARGAARELLWGLPAVAREVNAWQARAKEIPDLLLREDALSALARKRTHTDGAAMFSTIPRARDLRLLRVLVAFEIMVDFLDSVNERAAAAGQANGRQLHVALIDALDVNRPMSNYYRYHPWQNDGGYAQALVETCRKGCSELPSYERVRSQLIVETSHAQVLGVNHEPESIQRDAALREWAEKICGRPNDLTWFELTAAASSTLTIHALLALAAEPTWNPLDVRAVRDVYFPWASAANTMLDSYVDQDEDTARGDHSYISHYETPRIALERTRWLIQHSLTEARALPNGERHALIIASMIAMYLSKDSARTSGMNATTASLVAAGGPLTESLLPILRLWRIANGLHGA
jgi:tetraprenyl-beta-curcumene synthase